MSPVLKVGQSGLTTVAESDELLTLGTCTRSAPRPLSLRSNFSWSFAGNVVYAGCQWGMLIVLAKLGSAERVGQFSLGLALTAPVIMVTNLQLRAIQATDARRDRFGHYLALHLATTALSLLVIAGIACGYRLETALVILAIGLAKALESLSDVVYGLMQARERIDRIALSMMIKGPLSLVALGATVYFTGSIAGEPWSWPGLWDCFWSPTTFPTVLVSSSGEDLPPSMGPLPHRSPGLACPAARNRNDVDIAQHQHSTYFIERYWGKRELGIFAALAYLIVAGNTVVSALGQSASPRLAFTAGGRRSGLLPASL